MEEEEEEQDTSLKGRLMSLVYKIKGRPQKTEEKPTEQEQAAPSKACFFKHFLFVTVYYAVFSAVSGYKDCLLSARTF